MTLMYSNPALCAVFAWIVGTEAVTCICVAGVTASVVGVVLIAQPPFLFGEAAWDHTRMLGAGRQDGMPHKQIFSLQSCQHFVMLFAWLFVVQTCRLINFIGTKQGSLLQAMRLWARLMHGAMQAKKAILAVANKHVLHGGHALLECPEAMDAH